MPVQGNRSTSDDISSIIAFGGNKIGIMWSNQNKRITYFAVHLDNNADTTWEPREEALSDPDGGSISDNHINLAVSGTDGGNTVFAAVKSSFTADDKPLIYLLKRQSNGVWTNYVFALKKQNHTRPIVLVNAYNDSIYVIAKAKTNPIKIYMKRTHADNPNFEPGFGELFIKSNADDNMNDPTATKQNVTVESGLLALVTDKETKNYLHNYFELPGDVPIISYFTPIIGIIGSQVTISGSNFTGTTNVSFNGAPATSFTVDSDNQIRVNVPPGATTGQISLTNSDGTRFSPEDFTVILNPEITSFFPANGPATTEVTITGSNYLQVSDVAFNGSSASSFIVDSATQIRAIVPLGASTGPVSITNSAGTGNSVDDFTLTLVPDITSFTPSSGIIGTQITLSGINFIGMTDVAFNGISVSNYILDSDTLIYANVPLGASTGKISVTNGLGMGESVNDFTVVLLPDITSFSPDTGYEGLEIAITGSNFIEISEVSFNGTSALDYTVDSDTLIRAVVPAVATTGLIEVINAAGFAISSVSLIVVDPPVVNNYIPMDDARVWSSNPTNNYGTSSELRIKKTTSALLNSFLKFDVTGLGGNVNSAKIRLHVVDSSDDGGEIYLVSNNYVGTSNPWDENGLIWDNAPDITGTLLSSVGAINVDENIEFDVTSVRLST